VADFLFGRPLITVIKPRSGVTGSTVELRGALLPFGRNLEASGGYRCRYQQLTRTEYMSDSWAARFDPLAQYDDEGWMLLPGGAQQEGDADFAGSEDDEGAEERAYDALRCDVLPMPHGRTHLEISLHDTMYSADRTQFITLPARHEGTALRAVPATAPAYFSTPPPPPPLVPYTGPVVPPTLAAFMPSRNVTTTLVTGPHLDGGFVYACRPLPRYPAAAGGSSGGLPATYVPALRAVRCALAQPSANVTLPLALTLHVSLDGEQYNAGGAPFTFYPAPIISRVQARRRAAPGPQQPLSDGVPHRSLALARRAPLRVRSRLRQRE